MMRKKKPLKTEGACPYCKGVGMVPDFDSPISDNKVRGKPCPQCKNLTLDRNLTTLHATNRN